MCGVNDSVVVAARLNIVFHNKLVLGFDLFNYGING